MACVAKLLSQFLRVGCDQAPGKCEENERNYFALVDCVSILCLTISNVLLCRMNKEQWFAKFQYYS